MHVFILGPPGCGKTSVSTVLKERYGMCHITPTDVVAHAVEEGGTAYSESLRQLVSEGKAIPDALLTNVVAEATRRPDCAYGFLMDNYPQNADQARMLKAAGVKPDAIVVVDVDDQWLMDRYAGRWVHAGSGRMYHTVYNPPRVKGRDDVSRQPLSQRPEDTEEAVRQRTDRFRRNLEGLRKVYEDEKIWHSVHGAAPVDSVHLAVCEVLDPLIALREQKWWKKMFSWRNIINRYGW